MHKFDRAGPLAKSRTLGIDAMVSTASRTPDIRGGRRGKRTLFTGAAVAALALATLAPPAPAVADDDGEQTERIVVTGSRIARDEFSSPAPLQSLDAGAAQQIGITSLSELLQRTTVANGQQIDRTLNTNAGNSNAAEPPPLGGVGSANIGLRGLDPERTLVLINSRRLGSAGVRGAPAQPDLNLLPLSLVDHVEVITEGASAIYGADAVAGVVNVILRDSFEGLELSFNYEQPEATGGESTQLSFLTGASNDRGRFIIGGEYYHQERVRLGDRISCHLDLVIDAATGDRLQECDNGFFDNIAGEFTINHPGADGTPEEDIFYFHIPGLSAAASDIGIANWGSAFMLPEEYEFDGACERPNQRCRFPRIPFYSDEDERLMGDLVQPITRFSTVALGSYDLDFFGADHEAYFETYYFNRTVDNKGDVEQIFPTIRGMIPQEDVNGNIVVDGGGAPILVDNPLNPFPGDASLIITLDDFRSQDREVEVSQYRFVSGLRGDIPGLELGNWTYDAFVSYDRGVGFQSQPLMNETNLNLALSSLRLTSDGDPICGVPVAANDFGFITEQGTNCVPVNFFADSIFTGGPNGEGAFATEDERRFLIGERTNRTVVEQMLASVYFTGDLMELPAGEVATAFGGEYRRDRIKSSTDFLSAIGENAGENPGTEEATNGSRDIWDVYGEVFVPLLDNLSVEGAVRFTDEENFGSETTYRARASYSPIDWITLSGSYGTSFRAPNLREAFLAPQQQGVGSDADPCAVPGEAQANGIYLPGQETRTQTVLDNCVADGADPTALGLVANINIPVTVGGNALDLLPETSEAYTATLQFSPPVSDRVQMDFAISWYQITVDDNIRSIDPVTIMNRCFNEPGLASPFCSRLTRADNPGANFDFINFIDASFVNVGEEVSEGIDLNARLGTEFSGVDVLWNGVATFLTDRTEQIFPEDAVNDLTGDYGFPETSLQSSFSFGMDPWELLVDMRWMDDTFPSQDALENLGTAFNCAGPGQVASAPNSNYPGSPQTYVVCDADAITYWDTALTYRGESFTITGGINNLFDEEPPLVDTSVGSNRGNRVTSSGYDQLGRTFFVGVTKRF